MANITKAALNAAKEQLEGDARLASLRAKARELKETVETFVTEARVQRLANTVGVEVGAVGAAVLDYEVGSWEIMEVGVPTSLFAGAGIRVAAEFIDGGDPASAKGAGFVASLGDGFLAGGTYALTYNAYSGWREG